MDFFGNFRAGMYHWAGRRPVRAMKIGGFQGPERLLISRRNQAQDRFLEALGVSVPLKHNFQVCKFFVLKIGPDSGIFSRLNIGGKNSLRRELPHTRNRGSVLATAHPMESFWHLTSKLPRDGAAVGVWGLKKVFLPNIVYITFAVFKCF